MREAIGADGRGSRRGGECLAGSGRQLTLGFKRRWAHAVRAARQVLAEPYQVIIDDFRSILVHGLTRWKGQQDKGHRAHAAAFRQAVQGSPGLPTEAMLATMRATIQARDRAMAP